MNSVNEFFSTEFKEEILWMAFLVKLIVVAVCFGRFNRFKETCDTLSQFFKFRVFLELRLMQNLRVCYWVVILLLLGAHFWLSKKSLTNKIIRCFEVPQLYWRFKIENRRIFRIDGKDFNEKFLVLCLVIKIDHKFRNFL